MMPEIQTLSPTWTPKVCKIMAFMAIILGLVLLFYILLGSRGCRGSGVWGFRVKGLGFRD